MMPTREHHDDNNRADEPEGTRNLGKKALYEMLSNQYYLPDGLSKGVNRRYLVGVFTQENWRVDLLEHKRFLAELTPDQLKKVPIYNSTDAYQKMNALLRERGQREFGFGEGVIPEDKWLVNVARYIDQSNISALFMQALPNAVAQESESNRMMRAKRAAEDFLLGAGRLLERNQIYNGVKEIWETQKRLNNKQKELEALENQARAVLAKITAERGTLQSNVMKAAIAIYSHGNNLGDGEAIFLGENDGAGQARLQIGEIVQL